jgi:hypothetical protein
MANRKMGTGVGALVSVSACVYFQLNPSWGLEHPHLVDGLYLLTAAVLIVYLLQFEWIHNLVFGKSGSASPTVSQSNKVGRDNSGKLVAVAGDYHEAPRFPLSPPQIVRDQRKANIVTLACKKVVAPDEIYSLGMKKGDEFWVLEIQNRLEDVPIDDARAVCFSLEFTGSYHLHELIPRGWWLDHNHNEIDIPINNVERIVLGRMDGKNWIAYGNIRQFEPNFHQLRAGYYEAEPEAKTIDCVLSLTVEIKVFNRHLGTPYMQKKYRIIQRYGTPEFELIQ